MFGPPQIIQSIKVLFPKPLLKNTLNQIEQLNKAHKWLKLIKKKNINLLIIKSIPIIQGCR